MNRFSIIGIGPGHREYILPCALSAVEEAQVLVGGERHLALFPDTGKEEILLKGNYGEVLLYVRAHYKDKKIAILVSGDPGYHSLLGKISSEFDSDEYTVVPGISSFQLAMSRIGKVWDNSCLISFHGKSPEEMEIPRKRTLIALTDYRNTPFRISRLLLKRGFENRKVYICENLSYDNESIRVFKLNEIVEEKYKLCVMIIE